MAVNDRILVDGIIDERVVKHLPSAQRDEVFEFFSFEQILKFADLSVDEIKSGWVDGGDDGGIDGFFIFVNGHLLSDIDIFQWPRGGAELGIWLINCKHHDTFKQATVDKLLATISEIMNFSIKSADIRGGYSRDILAARERLVLAYKTLSTRISSFKVRIVYASRGDATAVGSAVVARARQVEAMIRELFGVADVAFQFVGAAELVALSRKARRYSLELPFIKYFAQGERYVLLSRLQDYAQFVLDEDGYVRRYLFDSNVRDFVGLNRVNEDIAASLDSQEGPDFWWLNNGITILVTKAMITGEAITLDDVQIVNGLQTTESIARHFKTGCKDPRQRSVLVKVIKTEDPAVRDAIIRATNNQTAVEQQSLHATDKVQRDIEEVLLRAKWYYDRRANHYANLGFPQERIVSPLYVAAGVVGILLRSPSKASVLKQRFMRNPVSYEKVFSETAALAMWPKLVSVLKFVDSALSNLQMRRNSTNQERFLKRWRHLVALIVVSRLQGEYSFSSKQLASLDLTLLTEELVKDVWRIIERQPDAKTVLAARTVSASFVRRVCEDAASEFRLADVESVEVSSAHLTERSWKNQLTDDFLDKVDATLPAQPWTRGIHRNVASTLGCSTAKVYAAIQELITRGRRNQQKDGVVFDRDGNVLAIAPGRSIPQQPREDN